MKISDINQDAQTIQYINHPSKINSTDQNQIPKEIKTPLPSEDKVDLSDKSKEVKKIHDVLGATPDVRSEKIDALKKVIESGQYQIQSNAIADKMIKESLLELNK